jgi:hypothetical protein
MSEANGPNRPASIDEATEALMDQLYAANAEPWEWAVALEGLLGRDESVRLARALLQAGVFDSDPT